MCDIHNLPFPLSQGCDMLECHTKMPLMALTHNLGHNLDLIICQSSYFQSGGAW